MMIHWVRWLGTGLMLLSLSGAGALPALAIGEREPGTNRNPRSYQWPGYDAPDRFTIYKGKKCRIRCERIRGTRDYRCREYRC